MQGSCSAERVASPGGDAFGRYRADEGVLIVRSDHLVRAAGGWLVSPATDELRAAAIPSLLPPSLRGDSTEPPTRSGSLRPQQTDWRYCADRPRARRTAAPLRAAAHQAESTSSDHFTARPGDSPLVPNRREPTHSPPRCLAQSARCRSQSAPSTRPRCGHRYGNRWEGKWCWETKRGSAFASRTGWGNWFAFHPEQRRSQSLPFTVHRPTLREANTTNE